MPTLFRSLSDSLCLLAGTLLPLTVLAAERQPAPLEEAFDLLEQRADWKSWPQAEFPRHPAERFLKGWTIVLDPGHGGDAHQPGYKRGPTGVREADINWRVGVLLERLLLEAGVNVIMTRTGDMDVSLRDRAEIANNSPRPDGGTGADLFISLHHNATGNPDTNYTSVWFHGEADWSEPDLDAARYIAHALFRYLRTDTGLTSYLMSDQQMFPRGFGVLNQTRVPAILLESSFHSNPAEEQRLRDAIYNLREAYAIYVGLCEMAYGGRPTQSMPELAMEGERLSVRSQIDDGLPKGWWGANRNRTLTSSVQFFLDDEPLLTRFDAATRTATASLPLDRDELAANGGRHVLRVHHANFSKNHNWPQRYLLTFSRGDAPEARIQELGARRARADRELPEPSAEAPQEEESSGGPPAPRAIALAEATIDALRAAAPGDIVVLEELHARDVPILDARLSVEPGPQLVFSDMPEYFRSGDGVAMEERVRPGLIRLYTYHVPEPTDAPKVITALIENLGEQPMNLRFHRYSFPEPSGHYHKIGKVGLMEFFEGGSLPAPRQIAPGRLEPVDPRMDATIVRKDQLVHGFYEFEIDQPARILTLQRNPDADNTRMAESLPRLPRILPGSQPSGAGRGLFPISNLLVTLPAHRALDTADGAQQLVVADGRRDPWVVGTDSISGETIPNKGNYGVLYRMRIKRTSSDGRSLAILMHNLYAENQFCRWQASAVKVTSGDGTSRIVPIPADQAGFGGPGQNVLLQTFPPLPEGESETIEILFSPPGASCLPTPVFFVPF
jgi:N-acetylmuramoyl-L-alanine amidase